MIEESVIDTGIDKKESFINTGIEKLNRLLEGGIPNGFTTIILGSPGSSTEILVKQIAAVGDVIYITTEETKDEIVDTMKRFNWNLSKIDFVDISSKYYSNVLEGEERRVSIYEQRSRLKLKELIELGSSSGMPSRVTSEEDYLAILSNKVKDVSSGEILIINSLDFFLSQYRQEDVLRTIYAAKVSNLKNKSALIIVMTKGVHGELFEKKMEGLADCVLSLMLFRKDHPLNDICQLKK